MWFSDATEIGEVWVVLGVQPLSVLQGRAKHLEAAQNRIVARSGEGVGLKSRAAKAIAEVFVEPATWGAVVSFAAMVVSAAFALSAGKAAKRSLEKQDKLVRMEQFRLEQEQRERVRSWGDEVVSSMQAAIDCAAFSKEDGDREAERVELAGKLSELTDRGRWLFENVKDTQYGSWKEGAYQGLRPSVLDVVLEAFNLVRPKEEHEALDSKALIDAKRRFVSEIQELVKPSLARAELKQLAEG